MRVLTEIFSAQAPNCAYPMTSSLVSARRPANSRPTVYGGWGPPWVLTHGSDRAGEIHSDGFDVDDYFIFLRDGFGNVLEFEGIASVEGGGDEWLSRMEL